MKLDIKENELTMKFNSFFEKKKKESFIYGLNDCHLFFADWCKEIAGYDPAEDFRGKYYSKYGAFRIIREHGDGEQFIEKVAKKYKWEEIYELEIGSLCLLPMKSWMHALGIGINYAAVFLSMDSKKPTIVGPESIKRIYRICHK